MDGERALARDAKRLALTASTGQAARRLGLAAEGREIFESCATLHPAPKLACKDERLSTLYGATFSPGRKDLRFIPLAPILRRSASR